MIRSNLRSGGLSADHGISDLDGYTFGQDASSTNYMSTNDDEFGFDPPTSNLPAKVEHSYSPGSTSMDNLVNWPSFDQEASNSQLRRNKLSGSMCLYPTYDAMMASPLPDTASVVSRFGQITPPRSNSATSSVDTLKEYEQDSKKAAMSRKKRSTKTEIKTEPSTTPDTPLKSRKRKAGRKSAAIGAQAKREESVVSVADDKRKMSLEKNRVAAAKCRINKKEKTDQLQRDSHDKAVQNTLLKQTILNMKGEIQQLQTFLMSHSSGDGCRDPEDIHRALSTTTQDQYATQTGVNQYDSFVSMHGQPQETAMRQLNHSQRSIPLMHDGYFQSREAPPLPEFDPGEFEIQTPM